MLSCIRLGAVASMVLILTAWPAWGQEQAQRRLQSQRSSLNLKRLGRIIAAQPCTQTLVFHWARLTTPALRRAYKAAGKDYNLTSLEQQVDGLRMVGGYGFLEAQREAKRARALTTLDALKAVPEASRRSFSLWLLQRQLVAREKDLRQEKAKAPEFLPSIYGPSTQ